MKISKLILLIPLVASCHIFSKEERLLESHKKSHGEKIEIYYVELGATTNDVIQVRKENQDKIIWVSEKYNYIKSSKLINDTSLQLVLSDTGYYNNKLDTININVK